MQTELMVVRQQLNGMVQHKRSKNHKRSLRRKKVEDVHIAAKKSKLEPKEVDKSLLTSVFASLGTLESVIALQSHPQVSDLLHNHKFKVLHDLIPALKKLHALVGLCDIKQEILETALYQLRVKHSDRTEEPGMNNIILTGPPGVGKTEVANIIAEIFAQTGQIASNKIVRAARSDLVGQYLGQTAIKTNEVIEQAKGGILFIDEVYALGHVNKGDSFAKECIDTIIQHMTDKPGAFILMVAGYREEVETCFLDQNKGLKRRFTIDLRLDGYDGEELARIFQLHCKNDNWALESPRRVADFIAKHAKDFLFFAGDMKTLLHRAKFVSTKRMWRTALGFDAECAITLQDVEQAKMYMHKPNPDEAVSAYAMYA
jgi:SpoVK/Ycf46/Vps4 family AAA+-type ATPase